MRVVLRLKISSNQQVSAVVLCWLSVSRVLQLAVLILKRTTAGKFILYPGEEMFIEVTDLHKINTTAVLLMYTMGATFTASGHRLHSAAKADVAGNLFAESHRHTQIMKPCSSTPAYRCFLFCNGVTGRNANQLTSPNLLVVEHSDCRIEAMMFTRSTMVGIGYLPRLINLYTPERQSNQQSTNNFWNRVTGRRFGLSDEAPTRAYFGTCGIQLDTVNMDTN